MSARILTSLDVRKVGTKDWQLLAPFVVSVILKDGSYLVRVPSGFVTDFASVPRIPLAFWLFGGIGDFAAAVHDYLYATGCYPRDVCDAIFREVLQDGDGASTFRGWAMHLGVRLGGASHYAPS